MTAVVAHRGASALAPQNTLAAFEAAWRAGAHSIELDVRLTRDGHVVVIHDESVDATTDGAGDVSSMDLADLRRLDAGSWFAPAFAGQRVPTFDEVVELLVARPGIELLLEVKGAWGVADVRRLTEPIARAGLTDRVVAQSFWPRTVEALRHADPALRRGLLVAEWDEDLLALCAELDVVACNPHGRVLLDRPGLVTELHAAGLQVMVWTLDEPEQWALATDAGVDAVITDRPDRLVGWLVGRRVAARGAA